MPGREGDVSAGETLVVREAGSVHTLTHRAGKGNVLSSQILRRIRDVLTGPAKRRLRFAGR